jgi:hypothetical protein
MNFIIARVGRNFSRLYLLRRWSANITTVRKGVITPRRALHVSRVRKHFDVGVALCLLVAFLTFSSKERKLLLPPQSYHFRK